ncbi:hypothetical protein RRG08_032533 [Elysia crispata]|uniref:Uncharacterized protein n=1 Tax=Elysia crispata TaxID=231223 RepID=A0AAE0ZXS8_9GAST|nr:hypothetical protein RRG08_032533 [Elysia crispata]
MHGSKKFNATATVRSPETDLCDCAIPGHRPVRLCDPRRQTCATVRSPDIDLCAAGRIPQGIDNVQNESQLSAMFLIQVCKTWILLKLFDSLSLFKRRNISEFLMI